MCCYNTERRYSFIGHVPPLTYIERVLRIRQMRSDFDTQS
jgi:hypothetical protein